LCPSCTVTARKFPSVVETAATAAAMADRKDGERNPEVSKHLFACSLSVQSTRECKQWLRHAIALGLILKLGTTHTSEDNLQQTRSASIK